MHLEILSSKAPFWEQNSLEVLHTNMVACTYEMFAPNSKPLINIHIHIHKCMYYKICHVLLL